MRLKGISPFEQHVEKFVVAIFAAVFLGVLAWQFIGPRNTVKVGTDEAPIAEGFERVGKRAEVVLAKVTNATPELPASEPDIGPLADFTNRVQAPVSRASETQFAFTEDRPLPSPDGEVGEGELRIAAVEVPPPARPVAAVHMGTVDPREVQATPELAQFLPGEMPYDKAGVTVETAFNGRALADLFLSDPDGDGPLNAMPRFWWDGNVQILGVLVERQALRPDGSWSDATLVPTMPGRTNYITEATKEGINPSQIRELARLAAESAGDIRRPAYLAIAYGDPWRPPTEIEQAAGVGQIGEIERLQRQLASIDADIARRQAQLEAGRNEPPAGPRGGGGPGGRPGPAGPRDNNQRDPDAARREGIQRQIDRLNTQRAGIVSQLAALGIQVEGEPVPNTTTTTTGEPTTPVEPALFASDAVRLWAHDITADRGTVYRYRLALVLNNPVFGRAAALAKEQQDLAQAPVLRSAWSDWTAPVRVDDELYYFITHAQDAPVQLGGPALSTGPNARAELYTFRWGYWRRGSVALQPGDPLRGEIEVPDLAQFVAQLAQKDPAARPGQPPAGGRGPGGRGNVGVAQPPAAPADGGNAPVPEEVPMVKLPVSRNTFLLDVAAVPVARAGASDVYEAVLREVGGEIVTRIPNEDQRSQEYARVYSSAQRGQEQLQPRVEEVRTPGGRPSLPGNEPTVPPPGGGGGGGSGGGGGG